MQPDAPQVVVRSNFFALMRKLRMHPDLGGDHMNAALLTEAYATLGDPALRAAYDVELLERYDLAALGQGCADARRDEHDEPNRGTNRRSYYRVLQVQREAPGPVVEESYRTLRKAPPSEDLPHALLDEAFEVLGDPEIRERYDALLESAGGHLAALAELGRGAGYAPLITRFCVFCKTPHAKNETDDGARCDECASPLTPPPESLRRTARRVVARLQRRGSVSLRRFWPGRVVRARLVDLSPTGMRIQSTARFDEGDLLQVEGNGFRAVGAVAHCHVGWMDHDTGLRFLTVSFLETVGGFLSVKL